MSTSSDLFVFKPILWTSIYFSWTFGKCSRINGLCACGHPWTSVDMLVDMPPGSVDMWTAIYIGYGCPLRPPQNVRKNICAIWLSVSPAIESEKPPRGSPHRLVRKPAARGGVGMVVASLRSVARETAAAKIKARRNGHPGAPFCGPDENPYRGGLISGPSENPYRGAATKPHVAS